MEFHHDHALYGRTQGGFEISPVLYRNSGDAPIGDKERVVGYWAIAGHDSTP